MDVAEEDVIGKAIARPTILKLLLKEIRSEVATTL